MAGLRDKLNLMASLSAPWQGESSAAPEAVPAGLSDTGTPYPLTEALGEFTLRDFLAVSPGTFFGLNDGPCRPLDPERVLFLDTETTGLYGANVQAFLVGLGYFENGCFTVRQLLMEGLDGEDALLHALAGICGRFDVLVTFNGKAYDLPLIEARMGFCRIPFRAPWVHIDLLHPARRIYKLRIESCRLSNLEDKVFCSGRKEDIDGAEIPGRYFRYIRSGDKSLLTDILDHNRQDIVTMPILAAAMCRALSDPEESVSGADRFSIGRYYLRQKDSDAAARFFSSVQEGLWSLPSLWQKSLILKKTDPAAAAEVWLEILSRTPDYCPAMVELCKYHEHTTKNTALAYEYCLRAMETGMGKTKLAGELARRYARLAKKQRDE